MELDYLSFLKPHMLARWLEKILKLIISKKKELHRLKTIKKQELAATGAAK
jgi:hypothetical protein